VRQFPYPRLIRRVVYRPDGRQVAWIGMAGGVRAVDLESGQVVVNRRLPPTFEVPAFSPDGRRYAASNGNGKVGVWELATGAEVLSIQSDAPGPHYLAFSPDGERLVIRARGALYYWDLAADQELRRFPLDDSCQRGPAVSPDGQLLAQGTTSGLVRIWDLATGQLLQTPAGHAGSVLAVKFSPDSQHVASAGADGTVRLWAVQTGAELLLLRGHQGRVGCLSFHPSGHYLASGSEQPGDVKIWDLTRPQEHVIVKENPTAFKRVEALGFNSDGQTVLVARPTGWLQVSEAATGMDRDFRRIDVADVWRVPSTLVAISTDGQQMAAVSKESLRVVKLLDTMDGRELHSLSHAYPVLHMAFSADGRRLATSAAEQKGSGPREVSVWDTATGQRLVTIPCEPFDAGRLHGPVALSPDGLLLAHTESALRPGEEGKTEPVHRIQLRDAATGESLQVVEGVPDLIEKLAFSPDGRHLAVSLTRGVMVYDVRAGRWLHGKPLNDSTGDLYTDLAFSPDGRRLAAIGREQALIWDVATGQLVLALRGAPPRPWDNGFNPHIAWSPDGRRLAASNWNNTVSIWDSAERQTPAAKRTLYQEAEERAHKP
jgi:WD40 repeat protein